MLRAFSLILSSGGTFPTVSTASDVCRLVDISHPRSKRETEELVQRVHGGQPGGNAAPEPVKHTTVPVQSLVRTFVMQLPSSKRALGAADLLKLLSGHEEHF